MITAQHVVNSVLQEAAKLGRADETMVLVTDRVQATLRWAGNSMTTNGVSVSRTPVAARMALASAAPTGLNGLSLMDFAPNGPTRSTVSANRTSVRGRSAQAGMW